ncbi:BolA family transcriptional regulator [Leptospira ognonensis]|uniref:BolA family transcriptional regulator n=1 Tax=Leptospira ognonensis TaxID=2484945 RepID=A0A4R9JYL7_9LEPT|nr:BolA family protein [Leptospira ognonensis]TGL57291.1 BolA family transcriptional regulator [Leptospira ognonensis]
MELETRKERIYQILEQALTPSELLVIDDSNRHAGHIGSSPSGETHFQIKISSPLFKDLPLVEQHRKIYSLLAAELKNGLHALEIESKD